MSLLYPSQPHPLPWIAAVTVENCAVMSNRTESKRETEEPKKKKNLVDKLVQGPPLLVDGVRELSRGRLPAAGLQWREVRPKDRVIYVATAVEPERRLQLNHPRVIPLGLYKSLSACQKHLCTGSTIFEQVQKKNSKLSESERNRGQQTLGKNKGTPHKRQKWIRCGNKDLPRPLHTVPKQH